MTRESLAFAVSGVAFGLLAGWIIGSQQAPQPPAATPVAAAAPAAPSAPAPLDQARVSALQQRASAEPRNAGVRVELADLYFDAERFEDAATWYEAALEIDPRNAAAHTDLAVVYFYQGQPDRALAQIDRALAVEPRHAKALLNQGIIRWQGKQGLAGAAESWERVVAAAPDSEEGRVARLGLEGLKGRMQQGSAPAGGPQP